MYRFLGPVRREASLLLKMSSSAYRTPTCLTTSSLSRATGILAATMKPQMGGVYTNSSTLGLDTPVSRVTDNRIPYCTTSRPSVENEKPSTPSEGEEEESFHLSNIFTSIKASPAPAVFLGFGGLVPFAALTGVLLYQQQYIPEVVFAQIAYGATILSFVGGARWGLTIPKSSGAAPSWWNLIYSVTPPGLAWMGLVLPVQEALVTLIFGFSYAALLDVSMAGYPAWFKAMRTLLTVGVVGLLLLSLFGVQD